MPENRVLAELVHPDTVRSIEEQIIPCGCHRWGRNWYLCDWHDGYEAALDHRDMISRCRCTFGANPCAGCLAQSSTSTS